MRPVRFTLTLLAVALGMTLLPATVLAAEEDIVPVVEDIVSTVEDVVPATEDVVPAEPAMETIFEGTSFRVSEFETNKDIELFPDSDATLNIDGNKTINSLVVYGESTLTIQGTGTLTIKNGSRFYCNRVRMKSGSFNSSGDAPMFISAEQFSMEGGSLLLKVSEYMGLELYDCALKVTGGTISITGIANSGIAANSMNVSGGTVTVNVKGIAENDYMADGIWLSTGPFVMSGGTVKTTATNAGLQIEGNMTLSGGTLELNGWYGYDNQLGKTVISGGKLIARGTSDGYGIGFGSSYSLTGMKITQPAGAKVDKDTGVVVDKNGNEATYVVIEKAAAGKWIKDKNGKWWYKRADGTYPKSKWENIDGKWYHFDAKGYMQTGWQKISGKWYYFNASGVMQTGWVKASGKWYYMNSSGAMQTGWQKISGKWYYFESSGAMLANTSKKIGKKTYTFDKNGVCTNP